MDWNKSNTILIIAFLIVNIFLFSFTYFGDNFTQKYQLEEKAEFLQSVKDILNEKKIIISCEVPNEISEAPLLDVKYDIIYPSKELVENFIGKYNDTISNEILFYKNNNESLEIVGRKKIIYNNDDNNAENTNNVEVKNTKFVDNIINEFCDEKKIDLNDFSKEYEVDKDGFILVRFVEKYKNYSLDNAYIHFYISGDSVFKFEMQKIVSVNEGVNIKSISAAEALLRLMTFDYINNKEIIDIQICYYSNEDENFGNINSINVSQVWKVIFNDDSFVYLLGEDY